MFRNALLLLVVLILGAAAVNVPFAILAIVQPPARLGPPITDLRGPDAASAPWPVPTPERFPPPTTWSSEGTWRARAVTVWSVNADNQTTHQMQAKLYGWPLPALMDIQIWSTGDMSPRFVPTPGSAGAAGMPGSAALPPKGLELAWPGVLLNPVLVAVPVWLVLVVPWCTVRFAVRRSRMKRGACAACGYPRGEGERCSECGARLP